MKKNNSAIVIVIIGIIALVGVIAYAYLKGDTPPPAEGDPSAGTGDNLAKKIARFLDYTPKDKGERFAEPSAKTERFNPGGNTVNTVAVAPATINSGPVVDVVTVTTPKNPKQERFDTNTAAKAMRFS